MSLAAQRFLRPLRYVHLRPCECIVGSKLITRSRCSSASVRYCPPGLLSGLLSGAEAGGGAAGVKEPSQFSGDNWL